MLAIRKRIGHPSSKLLLSFTLSLLLLSGIFLNWCYHHFFSENARFEAFAGSLFQKEVSGNMLNLHYSLAHPEKQGISRPRAALGAVELSSEKSTAQCQKYEKRLKTFSPSKLSVENRLTLDMLLLYFHTQASGGEYHLLEEPLGPSLGIQAQLPVLLAEYTFYEDQDITDYLNLLASIPEYFQSILAFEQEKAKAGFFMCDETLDRIQEQCRSFITEPDSSYMQEIFVQKLKNYGRFSQEDLAVLEEKHKELLSVKVFPAYQQLIDGLEQLRHSGKNPGGLAGFAKGQNYYQYLLQSQVGIYWPVKKLEARLTQQLHSDSSEISALLKKSPELSEIVNAHPDLPSMKPEKMMELLQQNIKESFPEIGSVSYEIRSVHTSMEEFLSPAFYLTPPLDTGSPNVIYINHGRSIPNLELFTTLSHEGFPGHLYQTIFFGKQQPSGIRYLIDSGGYVEGWATYVESYAYDYAAQYLDTDNFPADSAADYTRLLWLNRSVNLCIYALLDVGIHYHGWSLSQTARFLNAFGIRDVSVISEIYRYIAETPANYLKYYVGYLNFKDLKEEQEALLGDAFDLKTFHYQVLTIGPVQFPVLEKYIGEFS